MVDNVLVIRTSAAHTVSLAEEFLASYRGAIGDPESLRVRNEARDRLNAKLDRMGVHKINLMSKRQLRHFAGWLLANMAPGYVPRIAVPTPAPVVEFGKRKPGGTINGFGQHVPDPDDGPILA